MSRTMKVFSALLVITGLLSGWLLFRGRPAGPPLVSDPIPIEAPPPTTMPSPIESSAVNAGAVEGAVVDSTVATPGLDTATPPPPSSDPATTGDESARAFAASIVALDERRLRDVDSATSMTAAVAAAGSRDVLIAQAVRQTNRLHTQLGAELSMWAQPLRARTIRIDATSAVVDVWWVKVITGPQRLTAGDVWGTTRFTLAWEDGGWKVANEESRLGPWPTHATDAVRHPSGAAFAAELTGFTPIASTS